MYRFTTPHYHVARPGDRFWSRLRDTVNQSVLKTGGFYRTVEEPTNEEVAAADVAYLGGHAHVVSDAEAAELTAAGYGSLLTFITDVPTPPDPGGGGGGTPTPGDPPSYGAGAYGSGIYGH